MAKAPKKTKTAKRDRRERRFMPRATTPAPLVYAIGAVGALAMGAGVWAQWGRLAFTDATESLPYAAWLLAAAAVLLGVAIWIGTSGEPALRVGDGGIAVEKNGLQRMPWHGLESLTYDGGAGAVVAKGNGEAGNPLEIRARLASQPQAAAWMVREARERVPAVVDIGEQVTIPEARDDAGEIVKLEPVQVVGKRCAASGTIVAFEPDARVCPRCERVYHRAHVPETCACGASLARLRGGTKSGATKSEEAEKGDEDEVPSPA